MMNQDHRTDRIPTPGGLHAYEVSREIAASNTPFYALIMAAMSRADTGNSAALRAAFPELWDELAARYNAPGGHLPHELPGR